MKFVCLILLVNSLGSAATLTARAAGGNWSAAATWSTGGSGGAAASAAPTANDDVVLEAGSGNVTLDTGTQVCRSINATSGAGNYTGTLTHLGSVQWWIGSSTPGPSNVALKFSPGMTFAIGNVTTRITFVSTSSTQQTVDFGVSLVANVVFDGAGGSWILASDMIQNNGIGNQAGFMLLAGTFNSGNHNIAADRVFASGTSLRSMILGTSSVVVNKNGWDFSDTTNLTFSGTGASIDGGYFKTGESDFQSGSTAGPALAYGSLNVGCGHTPGFRLLVAPGTSFVAITIGIPWYPIGCTYSLSNNVAIGTLSATGYNSGTPIVFNSTVTGTNRNVTNLVTNRTMVNATTTDITFVAPGGAKVRHHVSGGE